MSTHTLAAVLRAAPTTTTAPAVRGLLLAALLPSTLALLLFTGWAALAPIAGAVIAPAEVRVELNRKAVAHAEGGIVRQILVREGQAVKAGDALVVVGDLKTDAALKLLQDQQRAARARIARAEAEAAVQAQINWPAALSTDPAAADPMAREQALFAARRRALDEQAAQLRQQVAQAQQQAQALQGQIVSTQTSAQLSHEELAMNQRLADQGYVHRSRLIGLSRISTDYAARLAEHQGNLAAVQQRSGEIGARLAELRLAAQAQAADELRQATALLREIEERLAPSRDQAERQTVRALADGTVMNLKLAAAGTVVAPRELLLEIVPSQEKLVVDARIAPQDVEQLRAGGAAEVKLLGSTWQRMAPLPARVTRIAPDRSSDAASGKTWFAAVVEVDAAALKAAGVRELQPGMPAEVYVTTGARSLLQYLAAPLDLFTRRALRES
jgi:HlyD family type I secretion membrane fusion protein